MLGLHVWTGTPPSPPHAYVVQRPVVAIVGGRAEHCLPRAWRGFDETRVVNLARNGTSWRSVVDQIAFARSVSPPAVLVAAIDPEQLLYERDWDPDPDRVRRARFAGSGLGARVYGLFDRWLSLPRLLEAADTRRFDAAAWGAAAGQLWPDPDALRVLPRILDDARRSGIEVHTVALPLPQEAADAWRSGPRGESLDAILEALDTTLPAAPEGYFPDGLTCARITGRAVLDALGGELGDSRVP